MKKLNRVFTFAISTDEDGPTNLLFSSLEDDDILNPETMEEIAQDKTFKEVMGEGAMLLPLETYPNPVILATKDVTAYAIRKLESSGKDEWVTVYTPEHGTQNINLYDCYYDCTRPEKLIVGCNTCALKSRAGEYCAIRQAGLDLLHAESICPEDLKNLWTSGKETIAGFKYVSPVLTAIEYFRSTFRGVSEHDFSFIEQHSEERSKGAKERARVNKFKKEVCPQCFLHAHCLDHYDNSYSRYKIRYCKGPYPSTEKEAVERILNNVDIPFSDRTFKYYLARSGELSVRYKRCIYWSTFYMEGRRLHFLLQRKTRPYEIPKKFPTINKRKFLAEYSAYHNHVPRLTQVMKALVAEIAYRSGSPRMSRGFYSGRYPLLGIKAWEKKIIGIFAHSRGEEAYRISIETLASLYYEYGNFSFLDKSEHPLGWKRRY